MRLLVVLVAVAVWAAPAASAPPQIDISAGEVSYVPVGGGETSLLVNLQRSSEGIDRILTNLGVEVDKVLIRFEESEAHVDGDFVRIAVGGFALGARLFAHDLCWAMMADAGIGLEGVRLLQENGYLPSLTFEEMVVVNVATDVDSAVAHTARMAAHYAVEATTGKMDLEPAKRLIAEGIQDARLEVDSIFGAAMERIERRSRARAHAPDAPAK